MTNVELRNSVNLRIISIQKAERNDLHNSSFVNRHSSFNMEEGGFNYENKCNPKWYAKNNIHGAR